MSLFSNYTLPTDEAVKEFFNKYTLKELEREQRAKYLYKPMWTDTRYAQR